MTVFLEKTLNEIELIGKKMKLSPRSITKAKSLYTKVTQDDSIKKMRTTQLSLALACIYVANAVTPNTSRKVSQYELTFRFKISPTTIRKVYKRICDVAGINRIKINPRAKGYSHAEQPSHVPKPVKPQSVKVKS